MTNLDLTKPIVIAATDWQEELPARLVKKNATGNYRVFIDAPHRVHRVSSNGEGLRLVGGDA